MENGDEEGVSKPMSAIEAMRQRFEQNNIVKKPVVTPKQVGHLGGGGGLNIFAAKKNEENEQPGLSKPGNIRNRPEPVIPRDESPNTEEGPANKRKSSLNIPSVFTQGQDPPAPAVKPKPKPRIEPRQKSDANNNADQTAPLSPVVIKPKISAMKPEPKTGNTSPRGGPQTSPRGGQVSSFGIAMQGISPSDLKRNLKPVKKTIANADEAAKPENGEDTEDIPIKTVDLRNKFERLGSQNRRKSFKSVILRKGDSKKFHKNDSIFENSGEAPAKPEKLDEVLDIENLIEEFKKHVTHFESGAGESGVTEIEELEEEEEYDDVAAYRREEARVSLIQPMTEEDEMDEQQWKEAGFTGLDGIKEELPPPPDDFYDDGISPAMKVEEDTDELYEPLPEDEPESGPPITPKSQPEASLVPPPVPELKSRKASDTDLSKESKESEKERKKREKEEREKKEKEEKERKKREKELKALLSTFSISAEDLMKSEGKGKIKKTAKASNKKCLAVQEGDMVDIIRMVNKGSKGKWLVRIDTTEKVGYVDADNIELMANKGDNSAQQEPQDGGDVYEAVEGAEDDINGFEEDEIYEECT